MFVKHYVIGLAVACEIDYSLGVSDKKSSRTSRISDVARLAGVSSATVSRVLSGKPHVSAAVRAQVEAAVETLRYRPNRIARSLRVQRSRVIGLIVSDIQNPFFSRIVRGVEDAVQPHGFAVFVCNTDESPEREALYLELLLDEQVAGVILTPAVDAAPRYRPFTETQIPLVVLDRQVTDLEVDTVVSDNFGAARAVVTDLIASGHRRIGTILSDLSIATGRDRFLGYQQALTDAGLPLDPALSLFGKPVEAEGYRLAEALLSQKDRPTALFSGSRLLTSGVLRYLWDAQLRIPGDLALASFDTLDWLPDMPKILCVAQPAYDMGQQAAALLLRRMAEPERPPERLELPSTFERMG